MVNHPNLSDDINRNISQSEIEGGAWLDKLLEGRILHVQTRNTHYEIKRLGTQFYIRGHRTYCPEWEECFIQGSTWGGSMLKVGFVGLNMHLEFHVRVHGTITTTKISSIIETDA